MLTWPIRSFKEEEFDPGLIDLNHIQSTTTRTGTKKKGYIISFLVQSSPKKYIGFFIL